MLDLATLLPNEKLARSSRIHDDRSEIPHAYDSHPESTSEERRGYTIVLSDASHQQPHTSPFSASTYVADPASPTYEQERIVYQETLLPGFGADPMDDPSIPLRIREMLALYEHGDGSFEQKCKSFYIQGKFMEDFEDDAPWQGSLRKYFPTYRSLNIRQLRGYFTWRTYVRKGHYFPVSASLAYLYIYELLNGIGVVSVEESLQLMDEFEREFIDAGLGNEAMRENLHNWAFELSIMKGLSPDAIESHLGKELLKADHALCALREPESFSDSEVYESLVSLLGKKQTVPPVVKKDEARGKHLFAQVWRFALKQSMGHSNTRGADLFEELFGKRKAYSWRPLANAIYFSEAPHPDCEYELNPCRRLVCRNGFWKEERYESLYFNKEKLRAFFRGTDRLLRDRLKTGHYLLAKPEELWVTPLVDAVLEDEDRQRIEAARPKITIDVSCLDQIRSDAIQTRDSLIVEEAEGLDQMFEPADTKTGIEACALDLPSDITDAKFEPVNSSDSFDETLTDGASKPVLNEGEFSAAILGLDSIHLEVLRAVLQGKQPNCLLKENHFMPSVVVDAINEALFDEIGDNVLEYDAEQITFVEDYREDVESLIEGKI